MELGNKTNVDVNRILSSFFAEVTPVKGLTLKPSIILTMHVSKTLVSGHLIMEME